jgi:hypothetical protein
MNSKTFALSSYLFGCFVSPSFAIAYTVFVLVQVPVYWLFVATLRTNVTALSTTCLQSSSAVTVETWFLSTISVPKISVVGRVDRSSSRLMIDAVGLGRVGRVWVGRPWRRPISKRTPEHCIAEPFPRYQYTSQSTTPVETSLQRIAKTTIMPAQATAAAAAPVTSTTPSSRVPPPDTATKSASSSSSETNTNASTRLSNTTAFLPIVIGSIAFYLGKKADEFQSHEWTLYVRGPNHEDLSVCISKVIFQLHASFAQPIRELTQPPFEVTERGWGEFEAQIRIFWKDPNEKPTVVSA